MRFSDQELMCSRSRNYYAYFSTDNAAAAYITLGSSISSTIGNAGTLNIAVVSGVLNIQNNSGSSADIILKSLSPV